MAKLRSDRGCGTALNSRTRGAAPAAACFLCGGAKLGPGVARRGPRLLRRRWSKPSRPVCLTGALHPFLMSPVGTPPGEGCLEVCPRGRGEMGRRDALKLWLAPRVKKRLIRCAPGGPAQYTAPKWASPSPLFPLLTVRTSAEAPISSPSVATRTCRFLHLCYWNDCNWLSS